MNERVIFEAALEIADRRKRQIFIEKACKGDADLRAGVEALLNSHDIAGSFLDIPAVDQMGHAAFSVAANTVVDDSSPDDDDSNDDRVDLSFLKPSSKTGSIGTLGHYEILEVVGQGGFGVVFRAFDEKLHRQVAIKVMGVQMAATSPPRKRFLREARSAAAIRHENIVQLYSVEEQPLPFLVMEYIDGETLGHKLDSSGPLEISEVLYLGRQIAAGLAAAHAIRLIHRDVKPGNILLERGVERKVKITDFGLARATDDASLTRSGMIAGTPMYMAPEQAMGKTLDHRADLFSLGSVLYQMACGRPPFRAPSTIAVLRRVAEDTPRALQEIIPDIPDWLVVIINKLLAKNPEERFQSAKEVADLLARCQSELQSTGLVTCVNSSHQAPHDEPSSAALSSTVHRSSTQSTPQPATVQSSVNSQGSSRRSATATLDRTWLFAGGFLALAAIITLIVINRGRSNNTDPASGERQPIGTSSDISKSISQISNPTPGWHGWPADAPKPAIAPFDAATAKKHQEEWAAYLKVPVEWENSIGMKFRLIPPGEYHRGSPPQENYGALVTRQDSGWKEVVRAETPRHEVVLTRPVYIAVHETTQENYETLMTVNTAYFSAGGGGKLAVAGIDTRRFPAENLSQIDAAEFCTKLSEREDFTPRYHLDPNGISALLNGTGYRLLAEAEWEFACRAGTTTSYHSGNGSAELTAAGWYAGNSGGRPHPVGELTANAFGLFDLHGNVLEWCEDGMHHSVYQEYQLQPAVDPLQPRHNDQTCVFRGGCFASSAAACRSASKDSNFAKARSGWQGFRAALSVDAVKQALKPKTDSGWHGWPADAPKPAIAPFNAAQAETHQKEWAAYLKVPVEYENSIGMKFRLIPPGEFTMGSTEAEIVAAIPSALDKMWVDSILSEAPRHTVILTRPVFFGILEVTQADYEKVMGNNPADFSPGGSRKGDVAGLDTMRHPVEHVGWADGVEFCIKLSQLELLKPFYRRSGAAVVKLNGMGYCLPTEAQWEFACRAGTTTSYWTGDSDEELLEAGWIAENSGDRTHVVGQLKPNPFGLYDMFGNVWERVEDWWEPTSYGQSKDQPKVDPHALSANGSLTVMRGSCYSGLASHCRSSHRHGYYPTYGMDHCGFRVVLSIYAVKSAIEKREPAIP